MPSPCDSSDDDGQQYSQQRRKFLFSVGAAAALAGCLGGTEDGDGNETDDTDAADTTTSKPNNTTTRSTPTDEDGGTESEQGLSRAEARNLLPLDALAFRYEPPLNGPFGEFWVAVVGETEATAVRAESESGNYNEVTPQDGTIDGYLGVPVQVDPSGDAVTAFAVDETGATGPVASSRVPTDELTSTAARQAVPLDALSFAYEAPGAGDYGQVTIDITAETDATALVARPQEAPSLFTNRVGDIKSEDTLGTETTLSVPVEPSGDEVRLFATVGGATGEVTRWQGPD